MPQARRDHPRPRGRGEGAPCRNSTRGTSGAPRRRHPRRGGTRSWSPAVPVRPAVGGADAGGGRAGELRPRVRQAPGSREGPLFRAACVPTGEPHHQGPMSDEPGSAADCPPQPRPPGGWKAARP
jgi:hypothetical protein